MSGVYVTDFGPVVISNRTRIYLLWISPEWEKLANSKPRSKAGKAAKAKIEEVFSAIRTCAAIEWYSGGKLEVF